MESNNSIKKENQDTEKELVLQVKIFQNGLILMFSKALKGH